MRAIIVDDEILTLTHIKMLLEREFTDIVVIDTYSNPTEAERSIARLKPDVVFLDINMPEMNGLELAERVQTTSPLTQIIFITAHHEYAVEAFDLNALDYLLKPVSIERLKKTAQRLNTRSQNIKAILAKKKYPIMVCCFSHLHFRLPNNHEQMIKWRTSKTLEVFAYLLHHRNKVVNLDTLIEQFWPDFDVERAIHHLYTTIYNIRRTLKEHHVEEITIRSMGLKNGYILLSEEIVVDVEQWELQINELGDPDRHNLEDHLAAFYMYTGDYFGTYDFLWAEQERERLRQLWFNHATAITKYLIRSGKYEQAIQVQLHIQQHDPYNEHIYFSLMQLYDKTGNKRDVSRQYASLTELMNKELGCHVNATISSWYQNWLQI